MTEQPTLEAIGEALRELVAELEGGAPIRGERALVLERELDVSRHLRVHVELVLGRPSFDGAHPEKIFLEAAVVFPKARGGSWIAYAPPEQLASRLQEPTMARRVLDRLASICDGHVHTDDLPERW